MKGVSKYENKRFKTSVRQSIGKCIFEDWKVSADSACAYIFHQPKMPKELKALKEK